MGTIGLAQSAPNGCRPFGSRRSVFKFKQHENSVFISNSPDLTSIRPLMWSQTSLGINTGDYEGWVLQRVLHWYRQSARRRISRDIIDRAV